MTTTHTPAPLDHDDVLRVAERIATTALHDHSATEEHGRCWELVREHGQPLTRKIHDGVQVTAEEYGTGQRIQLTVMVSGVLLREQR